MCHAQGSYSQDFACGSLWRRCACCPSHLLRHSIIFVPSGTAWDTRSEPAVYADSDHKKPCSDHLIVERCHVHVYAVIASFDVQVGPDHEQASPLAAAPLVSFQPKMTGPPPKA
jgi:hypothetical protein